jgi:16S rRNA (adenine1518-N6/adenine1519-N6)-dimethyltransferase
MIDFKPKKSLGQNFLKSEKVLDQIIDAAEINPNDFVLEIGPGKGALTEEILKKTKNVLVVEKDSRAVEYLKYKFKDLEIVNPNYLRSRGGSGPKIIEGDILDFNLKDPRLRKDDNNSYKIIANIPYYITGQILEKFLSSDNQPISMTLLMQKEVAKRIVAKDKKESLLSISVKIFGDPKYIANVKKESFHPKPKVDSAILHISKISKDRLLLASSREAGGKAQSLSKDDLAKTTLSREGRLTEKVFFKIVKAGFSHKRKLLKKNLSNIFISSPASQGRETSILKAFDKCEIEKNARAEDLSLEQWLCLAKNS